jgi:predicted secreted hydrolase
MTKTWCSLTLLMALALSGCAPDEGAPSPEVTGDAAVDAAPGVDSDTSEGLCGVVPEGRFSLPEADGPHAEPMEWWYWTGHLRTGDERWFGFEEVFFLIQAGAQRLHVGNFAITDIEDQSFHYAGGFSPSEPDMPEGGFAFALEGMSASWGDGQDALHGEVDGYVLDLELSGSEPPVLQHGDGYTDYPVGGYTYYYSRPRMKASGTLVVDGEPLQVTGSGWFDHQWGDLISIQDAGWDWFAIQLDDAREIMLFLVRGEDSAALVGGTLSGPDCAAVEIGVEDFEITPLGQWTSSESGCTYPMGWTLRVFDEVYELRPALEDQELINSHQTYWEGVAIVSGAATGRAYVELTGYCSD